MNSEVKVGAFTLAGAAILAGMISFMGAFNFGSKTYDLSITYDDAQGLLKGAEIRYAGVHVGVVKDIQVAGNKAVILAKINEDIKFPVGADFTIGSDGVMGERFVSVMPPKEMLHGYIAKGSSVNGASGGSMDSFLVQSTALLDKVSGIVEHLDKILTNEELQKSLKEGTANLTEVTDNLKGITENLRGITGVINNVSQEPETAQAVRETIYNVRDTSAGAKTLVKTLSDVEIDADVSHNMKGGDWRSSLGITLRPTKKDYVYLGAYDIGDKNKFDFLVGTKFGPTGISAGAMQGEFGVGLSYDVIKMFKIYSQLYDFDDAKIRVGGEVKLNDTFSIYGETMDTRKGSKRETYAGVRARF